MIKGINYQDKLSSAPAISNMIKKASDHLKIACVYTLKTNIYLKNLKEEVDGQLLWNLAIFVKKINNLRTRKTSMNIFGKKGQCSVSGTQVNSWSME